MKNSQIIEEPCEAKVSSTVLKTSIEGDFFAEFNKWSWNERKDWAVIDQAAAVLSDSSNQSRMIDLEGTKAMVCLDNLPAQQVACLMAAHASGESDAMALNSNGSMSLPPAEDQLTADLF